MSLERTDPEVAAKPFVFVFEVPGTTKSQVYRKALLWIADTYNSAESVITFRDEESATIKGTAIGTVQAKGDLYARSFRYHISIEGKDNRTRLQFSNVSAEDRFVGTTRVGGFDLSWKYSYDAIKAYFETLAKDYQGSLSNAPADSNW